MENQSFPVEYLSTEIISPKYQSYNSHSVQQHIDEVTSSNIFQLLSQYFTIDNTNISNTLDEFHEDFHQEISSCIHEDFHQEISSHPTIPTHPTIPSDPSNTLLPNSNSYELINVSDIQDLILQNSVNMEALFSSIRDCDSNSYKNSLLQISVNMNADFVPNCDYEIVSKDDDISDEIIVKIPVDVFNICQKCAREYAKTQSYKTHKLTAQNFMKIYATILFFYDYYTATATQPMQAQEFLFNMSCTDSKMISLSERTKCDIAAKMIDIMIENNLISKSEVMRNLYIYNQYVYNPAGKPCNFKVTFTYIPTIYTSTSTRNVKLKDPISIPHALSVLNEAQAPRLVIFDHFKNLKYVNDRYKLDNSSKKRYSIFTDDKLENFRVPYLTETGRMYSPLCNTRKDEERPNIYFAGSPITEAIDIRNCFWKLLAVLMHMKGFDIEFPEEFARYTEYIEHHDIYKEIADLTDGKFDRKNIKLAMNNYRNAKYRSEKSKYISAAQSYEQYECIERTPGFTECKTTKRYTAMKEIKYIQEFMLANFPNVEDFIMHFDVKEDGTKCLQENLNMLETTMMIFVTLLIKKYNDDYHCNLAPLPLYDALYCPVIQKDKMSELANVYVNYFFEYAMNFNF